MAVNGDSIALTTNVLGVATTPYKIPVLAPTAGYKLTADFAGDANDGPSDDTITVKVTNLVKMSVNPTSMSGPAKGSSFIATVTDNYGQPVVGIQVNFSFTRTKYDEMGNKIITIYGSAITGPDGTGVVSTLTASSGGLVSFYGVWPLAGTIPSLSSGKLCTMTLTVGGSLP